MATYDRVQVPESMRFPELEAEDSHLDEWGLVRFKTDQGNSLKHVCIRLRRRPKRLLFGLCVAVIVLIIIIAIAASSSSSKSTKVHSVPEMWQNKTVGLNFYPKPQDGSVLIKFFPDKFQEYKYYTNYLDFMLHDYSIVQQEATDFTDCSKDNAPSNKICKFDTTSLGPCNHLKLYGYESGTPCVLLTLAVPKDAKPIPYQSGNMLKDMKAALGDRYSPDYIGVSCHGATPADQEQIGSQHLSGDPIEYFPKLGFPTYYYRETNTSKFLAPLVMVKFNTVADLHLVHIKCTAWVQKLDNGVPIKPDQFSTSFVIYKKP